MRKRLTIAWYKANPEYVKEQNAIFDGKQPTHWKRKGDVDYWKTKFAAHRTRAVRLNRQPAWADETKIAEVFKNCPNHLLEIDHEFPLQGREVSGLHVHNNLQYLTTKENGRKHNNFKPRYFKRDYAEISLF